MNSFYIGLALASGFPVVVILRGFLQIVLVLCFNPNLVAENFFRLV